MEITECFKIVQDMMKIANDKGLKCVILFSNKEGNFSSCVGNETESRRVIAHVANFLFHLGKMNHMSTAETMDFMMDVVNYRASMEDKETLMN